MSNYLFGQGKLYSGLRGANGLPKSLYWLGDVSDAKLGLKADIISHKESYSGQKSTAKSFAFGKDATFDFTLMDFNQKNFAMSLYGTDTAIPSGSASAETLPVGLVAGDRIPLKYMNVSAVVVTDSAGTPATVTDTKYAVDATYGAITLLDVGTYVQPFKVAYSYAAQASVSIFTKVPEDIFIRYEGVNLAENSAPIVVELYRVSTMPLKELALINSKMSEGVISAAVLIDSVRPADPELGQFGRILQPTA